MSFRAAETARNLATASCASFLRKAHIAFERSFGVLRQPQDDKIGAPSGFHRDSFNTNTASSCRDGQDVPVQNHFSNSHPHCPKQSLPLILGVVLRPVIRSPSPNR